MADNVYLGAAEQLLTFAPEPMNLPFNPASDSGYAQPTQTPKISSQGRPKQPSAVDTGVESYKPFDVGGSQQLQPAETPKEEPKTTSNKNILLYAVGALVIGYLLLKKK